MVRFRLQVLTVCAVGSGSNVAVVLWVSSSYAPLGLVWLLNRLISAVLKTFATLGMFCIHALG